MASSDYRGAAITSTGTGLQHDNSSKKLYATVTNSDMFPSKQQAIIIEAQEGLSIKDYVSKISTLVSANDIRFVSKISNNRICVFFSSVKIAEQFTDSHKVISINDCVLGVRPLISKNKRIIISNVCPTIPHQVIEEELAKRNIQVTTKISFIKAGISEPGFSHIMSFRRQVYIEQDDISKLPESIVIYYDNTSYRIYFSSESISCFICKQVGHIAHQCPSKPQINGETKEIELAPNSEINKSEESILSNNQINESDKIQIPSQLPGEEYLTSQLSETLKRDDNNFPPLNKRKLATHTHSQSESLNCKSSIKSVEIQKQPKKKKKNKTDNSSSQETTSTPSVEELIALTKEVITSKQDKYPLTYEQFKLFLENSFGASDPVLIAKAYSQDIQSIIQ